LNRGKEEAQTHAFGLILGQIAGVTLCRLSNSGTAWHSWGWNRSTCFVIYLWGILGVSKPLKQTDMHASDVTAKRGPSSSIFVRSKWRTILGNYPFNSSKELAYNGPSA
jgi:hypothetical protein